MNRLTGNPTFAQVYAFMRDDAGFAGFRLAVAAGAVRLGKLPDGTHCATLTDRITQTESDWVWDEQEQDLREIEVRPLVSLN